MKVALTFELNITLDKKEAHALHMILAAVGSQQAERFGLTPEEYETTYQIYKAIGNALND